MKKAIGYDTEIVLVGLIGSLCEKFKATTESYLKILDKIGFSVDEKKPVEKNLDTIEQVQEVLKEYGKCITENSCLKLISAIKVIRGVAFVNLNKSDDNDLQSAINIIYEIAESCRG